MKNVPKPPIWDLKIRAKGCKSPVNVTDKKAFKLQEISLRLLHLLLSHEPTGHNSFCVGSPSLAGFSFISSCLGLAYFALLPVFEQSYYLM